jgi:hypothetical protein
MYNNYKENLALAQQLARNLIGQELRRLYKDTDELPEDLLALVAKLDDVEQD